MKEFILKYWLEFVFSVVIAVMGFALKKTKKKVTDTIYEFDSLKLGMLSLLRAELIRSGEKYLKQNYIPIYAKDAYDKAYIAYHNLGGNGTMTELHSQIMELKTTEIKKGA